LLLQKKIIEKGALQERYNNIDEASKNLEPLGITDEEQLQWACVPDTAPARGANVACEVLACEIEKRLDYCLENDVAFPRILFLQIDGGPENTSKIFYEMCEYLVKRVYLTE
jgi:hypothetical protein